MPIMLTQPTPITTLDRVDFVGSPKHITVTGSTFDNAQMKLWVWQGALTTPFSANSQPTVVFKKDKVSANDNYIVFEVGDVIKTFIDPNVIFNPTQMSASKEVVYYQYEIYTYSGNTLVDTITYATRLATLGWNWNYEGQSTFNYNRGSFGFQDENISKYYSAYLNYFDGKISLTGATNTNNMVVRVPAVYNQSFERCAQEQFVILYLNKYGLWDTFTPNGKIVVSNSISKEKYNRTFRNPLAYVPSDNHESINFNINSKQTYTINTGIISEKMGQLVEEILYSPKVYIVEFVDNISSNNITVDNTNVTVDNNIITVDGLGSSQLYTIFRQIPVIVTDTDFNRKTRINDKNKVSYNIKFEESSFKVNNIR